MSKAKLMVSASDILDFVNRLIEQFRPCRVILFGSHACGAPTMDSDVDLLVVMSHQGPVYRAASRIRVALDASFPLDILVRSPDDLRRRLAAGDEFLRSILEEGIVLYDRDDPRVGEQGRRRLQRRMRAAAIAEAGAV